MTTDESPSIDPGLGAEQARAIAREAFVYGFPFVEGYKTMYKQALDAGGTDFKAPFNHIGHARSVATDAPRHASLVKMATPTPSAAQPRRMGVVSSSEGEGGVKTIDGCGLGATGMRSSCT